MQGCANKIREAQGVVGEGARKVLDKKGVSGQVEHLDVMLGTLSAS